MVLMRRLVLAIILASLMGLGACSPEGLSSLELPNEERSSPDATPISSPTPPRVLSVCLGKEPDSLFLYGDLSASSEIVRQAIYDGPVDLVDFEYQPVILKDLPSQENGLVSLSSIEVYPGERLVDARGDITVLSSGVEFRPSGCFSPECWDVFESQTSITLDQVSVQFFLLDGLLWSDGQPLTPEDSLFSYRAAGAIYDDGGPAKLRFAADYQVLEDGGILWTGLPGYLGIYDYAELFFSPLPEHLWANYTREELLTSPQTALDPLGWGPYRMVEWISGDHITLEKNDHYHLAGEGLPANDFLVFRFVENGEEALAAYASGECDLVANTPDLANYLPEIIQLEKDQELNLISLDQPAWEQISFGVSSLDPTRRLLESAEVRQAVTMCIDRESIAARRIDGGTIAENLYHPRDPRTNDEVSPLVFQPEEAEKMFESLGWVDDDLDPSTPRQAVGMEGIPPGTALELSLLVPGTGGISITAEMIKDQLAECGVGVNIEYLPAGEMLAPGPEGPVFGRQFDLALFAWTTGSYHLCQIFQSTEIPGIYPAFPKGWGGANPAGYSSEGFDKACGAILTSLPDTEESIQGVLAVQSIFAEDLPVAPLFYREDLLIARPGLEGLDEKSNPPFVTFEYIR